MLKFLRIPEALQVLKKETNREWTASEVLDVAKQRNIKLHAAAPATARVEALNIAPGEGFGERHSLGASYAPLACLYPNDIGQLLISDEALTSKPYITSPINGQSYRYTEAVSVTVDTVRIQPETLGEIIAIWREAQGGPWVEVDDKDQPSGKRMARIWGPDWMFPLGKPAKTTEPRPKEKRTAARILERKREAWILIWLRQNKYNPKKLPHFRNEARPGVKAKAFAAFIDADDQHSETIWGAKNARLKSVFENTWERLMGQIKPKGDSLTVTRHKKRIVRLGYR